MRQLLWASRTDLNKPGNHVNTLNRVLLEWTLTKRVLAAELGNVSETFSRTLAKFREQKLLALKGKVVTMLAPARLGALLRRNPGE